jgi:hypothetical protein
MLVGGLLPVGCRVGLDDDADGSRLCGNIGLFLVHPRLELERKALKERLHFLIKHQRVQVGHGPHHGQFLNTLQGFQSLDLGYFKDSFLGVFKYCNTFGLALQALCVPLNPLPTVPIPFRSFLSRGHPRTMSRRTIPHADP